MVESIRFAGRTRSGGGLKLRISSGIVLRADVPKWGPRAGPIFTSRKADVPLPASGKPRIETSPSVLVEIRRPIHIPKRPRIVDVDP